MESEEKDESQVLETETTTEETAEAAEEETPEQLKARIADLEAKVTKTEGEKAELESKNKQLFERTKKVKEAPSSDGISARDYLAMNEAGVTSADYDEVVRVSKILGVSIADALKDSTMKTILATRAEERKTAAATHTAGGARGASKVSGEDLLSKAQRTGEVPETKEGMQELFKAQVARKLKK